MVPSSRPSLVAPELAALLAERWWTFILRGTVAILFGAATLVWPDLALRVMVVLVGGWLLVDGVLSLVQASKAQRQMLYALDGWLSVIAGLVSLFYPRVSGVLLASIVAIWALSRGAAQVVVALQLLKVHSGAWLLGASGAAAAIFGAFLLLNPGAGAIAMASLIAGFAIVLGAAFVVLGFWLERGL
jgi:uncharacterized membrane protein HdeD (DUF308 family)